MGLLLAASALLTSATATLSASVPTPPTGLKCVKSTSSSVTVEWMGNFQPSTIHLYDLEAGSTEAEAEAFPFSSVTVTPPSAPDPRKYTSNPHHNLTSTDVSKMSHMPLVVVAGLGIGTSATISQLKPDTDYFFKVRAHCAASGFFGCSGGKEQMIAGWSNFSAIIPCTTSKDDSAASAAALPVPAPLVETFWMEVWRVTENQKTYPDFLANHNTGTLKGDVSFLTATQGSGHFFDFETAPRVRYWYAPTQSAPQLDFPATVADRLLVVTASKSKRSTCPQ